MTILCWNVENLFDDVNNGTEYQEFVPGGKWNAEDFHSRLVQLTRVVEEACPGGPDILLLQEVENLHVLEVWNNRYLKGLGYQTVLITPKGGRAITTGILSRFPIAEFRSHGYAQEAYSLGRPIAEVLASPPKGSLRLFNNHWKSKSGGEEETEPMRRAAAAAVNSRLLELQQTAPEEAFILAGDFNAGLDEFFLRGGEAPTALMPRGTEEGLSPEDYRHSLIYDPLPVEETAALEGRIYLHSPWEEMGPGSYFYKGQWERIDHYFLSSHFFDGEGWEWDSARVCKEPWMLTQAGTPLGWNANMGKGFSDHLPLLLSLRWAAP